MQRTGTSIFPDSGTSLPNGSTALPRFRLPKLRGQRAYGVPRRSDDTRLEERARGASENQRLLPEHTMEEGTNKSVRMVFDSLRKREEACALLTAHAIRFRSGKTLVPFRLTGNIEWGLPAPAIEDEAPSTFWCGPSRSGRRFPSQRPAWKAGGKAAGMERLVGEPDCTVYQFIGVDNLFFYGLAEMAMFMPWGTHAASGFPS